MRILLADDHGLLRDGISMLLRSEADIEVETAHDIAGALGLMGSRPPFDLIILDINMPGMDGLAGMRAVQACAGGGRVALISGSSDAQIVQNAVAQGAIGFIPKSLAGPAMILAVRLMHSGTPYIPPDLMAQPAPAADHPLSPREREVLAALVEGKANKEIARSMELSEPAIKLHMKNILRKLGAKNRTQAALMARKEGWF